MRNSCNNEYIQLDMNVRRKVTLCNHNFSKEGIYHPDRIMSEYDLLYMQSGTWTITEEDRNFNLSPGSVILLEPGRHHFSLEKCSPMMRNLYIHFEASKDDIPSCQMSTSESGNGRFLFVPKFVETKDQSDIRHCFEQVTDAFYDKHSGRNNELECSLCLEELLHKLSRLSDCTLGKTEILISEIIHRFHCEPDRFLSPAELAENYNISERTLSGRFKNQTGMSVHQYQLNIKLDAIYDLLPISPGRSLHDFALSYGFYDEFQLSKLFKRRFNMSPSMRR